MSTSRILIDQKARRWCIDINVATTMRIKSLTGVSINELVPLHLKRGESPRMEALQELFEDGLKFFEVVHAICQPELERLNLTLEQFSEGFGGDTILKAIDLFCEALIDFFPSPVRKMLVRQILTKGKQAMETVALRAGQEIDKIDVVKLVNDDADRLLAEQSRSGFTGTPGR